MSLKTEQVGRARRNKRGHAKPSVYRKFVKNQTNRKARRLSAEQKPTRAFTGYD